MDEGPKRPTTVVIGAGPVGALAALYAAQRGHDVEVYELRSDLRDPSTVPLNFTRSINLALSERGINAMKHSGRPELVERILGETIPMKGRMIHGRRPRGELYEQAQEYDVHGRAIFAIDRSTLNTHLLNELANLPRVKLFFRHKLTGADFKARKAWFEVVSDPMIAGRAGRGQEIEVKFDFLIGADGAHSAARYHLMKFVRMDYTQTYIDTLWCEFSIEAKDIPGSPKTGDSNAKSRFRISPNHLHIWPGKEYMFIAIPSLSGDFTCTLFMPSALSKTLSQDPESLVDFFITNFPGVTPDLISPTSLISSFQKNPHLPLISITCSPYHFSDSAVIIGDAAHAMVPFYGQGMNAGLEDVRVLFQTLDAYSSSHDSPELRAQALQKYSTIRSADSKAICHLALENYLEMRSSVTSPLYKGRKLLEEKLSVWVPRLGWATKYSRVSFGNERYSEVVRQSEVQGEVLGWVLGSATIGFLGGIGLWIWKARGTLGNLLGLRI